MKYRSLWQASITAFALVTQLWGQDPAQNPPRGPHRDPLTAKTASAYSLERDPRPEIRAVTPTIKFILAAYKSAGGDASKLQQASRHLRLLLVTARARELAEALGPAAARAQAFGQLQQFADLETDRQAQALAAGALDALRPDKQAAAPSQSASSTQLVEKPGASSLLALSVDAGALTQSRSGTSTTLTGNLYGMYAAVAVPANAICLPTDSTGSCGRYGSVARNTILSASFDLAQPSTQSTTTTQSATASGSVPAGTAVSIPASVGKLSAISARYSVRNHFNPTSTAFKTSWKNAVAGMKDEIHKAVDQYLSAMSKFVVTLQDQETDQSVESILRELDQDAKTIASVPGEDSPRREKQFADDLDAYYQKTIQAAIQKDSGFYTTVSSALTASNLLQTVNANLVNQAVGNMFSLEYDYVRKPQQPDMHNFNFIWGNAPKSSGTGTANTPSMFSANFGLSVYNGAIPSGAKYGRLHYGQAAAEFDFPFGLNSASKNAAFTLAAYWQYQPSPSVLNITQSNLAPGTTIPAPTQVLVGTAGNLFVAQAKISFKGGKSAANIPLGLKWSNKTDLLSGSKYGGQFGISYDFSSISSLFGGGNQQQ